MATADTSSISGSHPELRLPQPAKYGALAIAGLIVAVAVPSATALLALGNMPRRAEVDEIRRQMVEVQRKLDRLEVKIDLLLPVTPR